MGKKSFKITELLEWISPTWIFWNGFLVFKDPMNLEDLPNDEVICLFHGDRKKRFHAIIPIEEGYNMDFVTYKESLVSIKGGERLSEIVGHFFSA